MAFDPNVYDEVTVTEFAAADVGDLSISVSEAVTVVAAVTSVAYETDISVYDEITVTDVPSLFSMRIYTDDRDEFKPKWPVWELEASTHTYAELYERMPGRTIEGHFGSSLDENRMPGWTIEGDVLSSIELLLDGIRPPMEVAGWFGCILEEKAPFWEISVTVSGVNLLRLDERVAGWTITASMLVEMDLVLDARTPRWELSGSISTEYAATLDESMPFWTITSAVLSGVALSLDAKPPFWDIEASMYSGDMSLDAKIPVWVLGAIGTGTGSGGGPGGEITDKSRFADYILQYPSPG